MQIKVKRRKKCKKIRNPSWVKSASPWAKATGDKFTERQVQSQVNSFDMERYKVYLEVGHRPQDVHGEVFWKDLLLTYPLKSFPAQKHQNRAQRFFCKEGLGTIDQNLFIYFNGINQFVLPHSVGILSFQTRTFHLA